jgi:pimeloyl-ACP methyl ester carboxylesterase
MSMSLPTSVSKKKTIRSVALVAATTLTAAFTPAASATSPAPPAVAISATSETSAASAPDLLHAFGRQTLTWQPCGAGFQCATLTVPQNYLNPTGPVFHLPVLKSPATDRAHRVGTLLANPGGPAQSGVAFLRQQPSPFSANLRARFDIVAWDRRGTAGSDPALHCLSDGSLDAFNHLDKASSPIDSLVKAGASYAAACRDNSAPGMMSNDGTLASTLDTEVLRSALGVQQISYLGYSYGTFQGAWYAQLFPTHVRSMVLDGMFDPALSADQLLVGEAAGFENELKYYENACATSGGIPCPASTPTAMRALIDDLTAKVRTAPLAVPGTARTVGPAELSSALSVIGVAPEVTWALANESLTLAVSGDGTGLLAMADFWNGRTGDGTYDGTAIGGTALWCGDRPWPTTPAAVARLRDAAVAAGPDVGADRAAQALPCTAWNPPTSAPVPLTAAGAPPIVVVSTTGDPATPYQWGVDAAKTFAHGVLLTYQGHGHTAYGRSNDCVTDAVDDDLINGTPPARGTTC